MSRVLAIANQKGGVGKTTTSVNLAASLAAFKRPTLLIDLDPQGNATMGSGIDKRQLFRSSYDVLMGDSSIEDALVTNATAGYHLLPGNADLTGAEVGLLEELGRELRLRHALEQLRERYDYIIIDCPPSLNMLTVNGLVAAEAVMIPMQCEYYALEGLTDLVTTLRKVRGNLNPVLQIEGLLRTMFDPRMTLMQQVSGELESHFGDKVYKSIIPRNVRLAEAPSYGKPVIAFDRASKGAQAYLVLAQEMLDRRDGKIVMSAASEQGALA